MKKTILRIGAILLLGICIYLAATILKFKSPHGIDQKDGLYWQPENTIDLVLMGSSHVHCGGNTVVLWEHYGIPAYDYSAAEQPLWMTYYYLQEFLKYQNPKVVFLDLYSPARFKDDYQYEWIGENIHGMKFSLTKVKMLLDSVEPEKLGDYFPSFAVYHGRYADVTETDYSHFFWNQKERAVFKGFTPYWKRDDQTRPDAEQMQAVQPGGLTLKSEEYLGKIIELTKEEGCELILGVIPHIEIPEDRATYLEIREIAEEQGVTFINFNDHCDQMGIDYAVDFHDDSHLNYWGSAKFSNYLGYFLVNDMGLTSKKGQEGYESWDEHVTAITHELMEQNSHK